MIFEALMRHSILYCMDSEAVMRHSVHFLQGVSASDIHCISHLPVFRFCEAWKTCQILNRKEAWQQLAESLLRNLEIEFGEDEVKLLGLFKIHSYMQGLVHVGLILDMAALGRCLIDD
jgi:hypothetical protein